MIALTPANERRKGTVKLAKLLTAEERDSSFLKVASTTDCTEITPYKTGDRKSHRHLL